MPHMKRIIVIIAGFLLFVPLTLAGAERRRRTRSRGGT